MKQKLIYIKDRDIFVDINSKFFCGETYTHDDLDFFMRIENEYIKNIPNYSIRKLLSIDMFPTAKAAAIRGITNKISLLKERRKKLNEYRDILIRNYSENINDMGDKRSLIEYIDKIIDSDYKEYTKQINLCISQKKWITEELKIERAKKVLSKNKAKEEERNKAKSILVEVESSRNSKITDEQIARAKSCPIKDYIKTSNNKAVCIFHSEKTPSLHIYPKTNKFYCFSCHKNGTVIDIVMQLEGLNFVEAVKRLATI